METVLTYRALCFSHLQTCSIFQLLGCQKLKMKTIKNSRLDWILISPLMSATAFMSFFLWPQDTMPSSFISSLEMSNRSSKAIPSCLRIGSTVEYDRNRNLQALTRNHPGIRYLVSVLGIQIFIFLVMVSVLGLMIFHFTGTTRNFRPYFLVEPSTSWFTRKFLV